MSDVADFTDRCESCGWSQVATHLLDFRDGGPVFLVCGRCAQAALDNGCLVATLDVRATR